MKGGGWGASYDMSGSSGSKGMPTRGIRASLILPLAAGSHTARRTREKAPNARKLAQGLGDVYQLRPPRPDFVCGCDPWKWLYKPRLHRKNVRLPGSPALCWTLDLPFDCLFAHSSTCINDSISKHEDLLDPHPLPSFYLIHERCETPMTSKGCGNTS